MFALSAAAAIVVAVMAMVFVRETPAFVKSRVEYPEQPYEVRHPAKVKRNKGEKQSEKEETRKAGVFPAFRRLLTNKTDLRWLAIAYMALTVGQLAISPATTSPLWPAAAEPVCQPLPKGLSVTDGVVTIEKDGKKLVSARPYTLLFRAPTDNDNGAFSAGIFREYTAQKETHLSTIISGSAIQVN